MTFTSLLGDFRNIKSFKYPVFVEHRPYDANVKEALESFDPKRAREMDKYTKRGASSFELTAIIKEIKAKELNKSVEVSAGILAAIDFAAGKVRGRLPMRVEPWTLEEGINSLNHATAAGYSFIGKKKGEVLDEIGKKAEEIILKVRMNEMIDPIPCLLGTRGHLREKESEKRRLINIVPSEILAIEAMFTGPIYQKAKEEGRFMFFGKNVIPRLRDLVKKSMISSMAVLTLDISNFDRDIMNVVLHKAFDIVKDIIDFEHWRGKNVCKAHQRRWKRVFDFTAEYIMHTPVMTPQGELMFIDGSMASGSNYTQLIDSIVSALYVETCCFYFGVPVGQVYALGDDVYAELGSRPKIQEWAVFLKKWFGATVSVKKTRVYGANSPHRAFLGYQFDNNGFLYRPTDEWFRLAYFSERYNDDIAVSYSRLIAYMHLGGVRDLKFWKFFEYFQSGYEMPNVLLTLDYETRGKIAYGGLDIEVKLLPKYTIQDFLYKLITYKQ